MDLPMPTFRATGGGVPSADASVRDATAADAPGMGSVQATAWRASYRSVLPADALAALEPEALAEVWRAALVRPPSGSHRVLVALSAGTVVGFVALAPGADDAPQVGEIAALVVTPDAQGQGHGSRLLNAAADRLRQNGFDRVVVWVLAGDDERLRFLGGAGFAPDGAQRTLAVEVDGPDGSDGPDAEAGLREIRLVATFEPAA